ncbi:MAG TPA: HAMP domain-containing sensor histidine kinase [Solirubrobacteraceae bacterium]
MGGRLLGALRRGFGRIGQRIAAAFDRLPIRTRLAGVSALLTFLILLSFALVVGSLTIHRIRADFDNQVTVTADQLFGRLRIETRGKHRVLRTEPPLEATSSTVIKVISPRFGVIAETPSHAPSLGIPSEVAADVGGYRVVSREETREEDGVAVEHVYVQYGQKLSDVEATVARVELLLVLGVLAGAGFALLAGMVIARRAMDPIAQLTSSAAEITRTRDPSTKLPEPIADDEVSELSRTLQGMLHELDSAHAETEAMLHRQRQFVADASHELRTPLTSVLANLELLAEALSGEEADAAHSALRSSQRMRRLVADLLLLARTDVGRVVRREPVDVAAVAIEAAAELGPISSTHEISLDARPARVQAARDEILRVTLNLIENAVRHTPKGTEIRVSTDSAPGGRVHLIVEDDGPGVPDQLRSSLFERFVRGAGDRGGSFGLGLAIVKAVAESHGGGVSVELTHPHPPGGRAPYGARFTVSFAAAPADGEDEPGSDLYDHGQDHRPPAQAVVDQLR